MTTLQVNPLTRVEGLGQILINLEGERLSHVELRLTEPPRLFESLLCGRHIDEVPMLVSRICAICATPHALAAILALEQALQVKPPEAAEYVRELALLGDLVQSHALHLFALVLPDQLHTDSLVELLRADNTAARNGLALKQFGNRVQELAGGRLIHPINLVTGGVSYLPDPDSLQQVATASREWQRHLDPWQELFSTHPADHAPAEACGIPLAVAVDTELTLWGTQLSQPDATLPVADYKLWIAESSVEKSHARRVTAPRGCWRVGALARRELSGHPPRTGAHGIFANNLAQLTEIGLALSRIEELCDQLLSLPKKSQLRMTPEPQSGIGTVALEAPRGTLIHQYGIDDDGRIATADIITPTTINQVAIEEQLYADLAHSTPPEHLELLAGQVVRAFDPCISCAVHLLRR